jgi:HSP20 family protein
MGIIDRVSSLAPWRGGRQAAPPSRSEVMGLRSDVDQWLQRFFTDPFSAEGFEELRLGPRADVRETDKEVVVTMEVPGLDRDDLELSITPEYLTIRGEKREERTDTRKDMRVEEYRYGSFVQSVPLPPDVDIDKADARVRRGVLTVTFPKVASREGMRRIPINT